MEEKTEAKRGWLCSECTHFNNPNYGPERNRQVWRIRCDYGEWVNGLSDPCDHFTPTHPERVTGFNKPKRVQMKELF